MSEKLETWLGEKLTIWCWKCCKWEHYCAYQVEMLIRHPSGNAALTVGENSNDSGRDQLNIDIWELSAH